MARWIIALVVAALVTFVATPAGRSRAFRAGWFERSSQTRPSRAQRRPTHGGLVIAIGLALGALLAGPTQPVVQATVAAAVLATVTGFRAEQAKGSLWVVRLGRVAAAATLPAVGIRAELTGGPAVDAVFTALVALVLMAGVRAIERTDATGPLVAGISALGLLLIAVRADDPVAPVAAALLGVCGAMVANTWPPAIVRIGTIGPTALGAALAAVAVELEPEVAAPRSMLVPLFSLLVLGAAALVPEWDRRLGARGARPRFFLPVAAVAGVVAADGVAGASMGLPVATAVAVGPVALLALVGVTVARSRPEGWVSHRGRNVALGTLVVVALGAVAAVAGLLLIDARHSMVQGRAFATAGLDAARDGDLEKAQRLFETADAAFADAASAFGSPAVRIGELVPGIAPNLRSARTLAAVGGDLSGTAVAVAERAGADDLLVVDGRFPVERAQAVSVELGTALDTLQTSSTRLQSSHSPFLLDEVREGSDEVAESIEEATASIEVVAEATRLAPALLGADGERRWMVAILTPSEQRGAGGLAGDFAELRAAGGDIELVRSITASEMNMATDPARQLEALPAIYRERYSGFRVDRFWQNLSATPDVPSLGQAVASAYPLTRGGGPVDGVITIDPYGIAALLELVGPVTVPLWPEPLTADNAARVLLFEHYDRLTEEQIDTFQGDVVEAVVERLTSGTLPAPSRLAATLTPAVAGGHLRLWSPEADPQALFERIGADGSLRPPADGSDFIELVTQSASESKIDWFLRRSLTYEPTVDPATGALNATATVTVTNTAPATGVSSYVIGEATGPTAVGENELRVVLYSPHRPTEVRDGAGKMLQANIGREQGLYAVTVPVEVAAGGSTTVVVAFEGVLLPSAGTYRLEVGHQPSVTPDQVGIAVRGAPGWVVSSAGGGRSSSREDGVTTFGADLSRGRG